MTKEQVIQPTSGWFPLMITLLLMVGAPTGVVTGIVLLEGIGLVGVPLIIMGVLSGLGCLLMFFGFQAVAPNDACVLLLFGE